MMQHVATSKSEVAAFASGKGTNLIGSSDSNEQFGKLLQDQKSQPSFAAPSDGPPPFSPLKKAARFSNDGNENTPVNTSRDSKITQDNSSSNKSSEFYGTHKSSGKQDNSGLQSISEDHDSDKSLVAQTEEKVSSESTSGEFNDDLKVGKTEGETLLPSTKKEIELELTSEPTEIVAEEWVTLVDNLQKLADIVWPKNASLQSNENTTQDISIEDLTLSNKAKKDLSQEEGAGQQVIDYSNALPETSGFGKAKPVDEKSVTAGTLVPQISPGKSQPSLELVIQQALEKLTAEAKIDQVTSDEIQQKTVELLLEQPEVLQNLLSQLQKASQKSDVDTDKLKKLDTGIDINKVIQRNTLLVNQKIEIVGKTDIDLNKVIETVPILADQQIATGEQADLVLAENRALLRTLLVHSESDKTGVQESIKVVKPVISEATDKLAQVQQVETLLPKLEAVAEQNEILDQDVQLVQVVPKDLLNSNKTEKVISNNDIKIILNLPDDKLNKVLENIAQRVFDSKKSDEPISPEQIALKVVLPKAAEFFSAIESSQRDFVSALKSGLEEFKNQLSQGREPGLDLKALVSDALAKTTDTAIVGKTPMNLDQIVNSVSQLLDFAQTMNRAIEHHHDQTYNALVRDVAQIQGEQSKQIQLNQLESKFEKAINITKPEGHQQLAEKVRWMVNTKNLVADIRLDPAELGSVHVKVAVSGESATVNFVVQSQLARDAVDNATPRLREMLAEKGIELGQSSVRQESEGQQGQEGELGRQDTRGDGLVDNVEVDEHVLAQQNIVNGSLGGIDYFV